MVTITVTGRITITFTRQMETALNHKEISQNETFSNCCLANWVLCGRGRGEVGKTVCSVGKHDKKHSRFAKGLIIYDRK